MPLKQPAICKCKYNIKGKQFKALNCFPFMSSSFIGNTKYICEILIAVTCLRHV